MEASFFLVSFPVALQAVLLYFSPPRTGYRPLFGFTRVTVTGFLGLSLPANILELVYFFSSLSLFGGDDACFASSPSRRLALASSVARTCTVARAPRGIF
jgi:hypothetical protein